MKGHALKLIKIPCHWFCNETLKDIYYMICTVKDTQSTNLKVKPKRQLTFVLGDHSYSGTHVTNC